MTAAHRVGTLRRVLSSAPIAAALSVAEPAHADDPAVDRVRETSSPEQAIDRSWLYVDDARVVRPGGAVAMTSFSYTSVGPNPDPTSAPYRAFAFNTAQPGSLVSLGGEVGLLPRLSLLAMGQLALGNETVAASPGAVAGLRLDLSPSTWRNVHLLASAGYLRETWSAPTRSEDTGQLTGGQRNGDNGAWAEAAISADVRRVRLGFTTHGEHVFAGGRDGLDVMVKAGASYRVADWLRAGLEWVGQDLEESVAGAAEGGARQFVGPTAAVEALQGRLAVVAGPSIGLSTGSPRLLGRVAVSYGF